MEFLVGLFFGIIVGIIGTYLIVKRDNLSKTVRGYELKIRDLEDEYQQKLKDSKDRSEVVYPKISATEDYQEPIEAKVEGLGKSYNISEIRNNNPSAYKSWTTQDDLRLVELYKEGKSIEELASELGRQTGGIRSRLRKLEQIE